MQLFHAEIETRAFATGVALLNLTTYRQVFII